MKSWKRGFSITLSSLKCFKDGPVSVSNKFKRSLSSNILPTNFPLRNLHPIKYITEKFQKFLNFYEEWSGMKDVILAQKKVAEIEEKLIVFQSERRKAFAVLIEIQSKLRAVHDELEFTKRGDHRYVHLIGEEYKLIKEEKIQQVKFNDVEKAERDQFTLFSHSVRTAHEKEKAQSQRIKYWSLIGSIMGTLLGIIGSSLNSHKKQSELKKLIAETSISKVEVELNKFIENYKEIELSKNAQEMKKIADNIVDDIKNNSNNDNASKMHKYLNEILFKTNSILQNLEETLEIMQNVNNYELYRIKSDNGSDTLFMNLQSFKDALSYENQQMRDIIWKASWVIGGALLLRALLPN